jgi:putative ABC transport system substrate-binding protein
LALKLQIVDVRAADEIDQAFATIMNQRPAALLVGATITFFRQRDKIVGLAARYRLPAMYESRPFVELGGLVSFGTSSTEYGRLARRNIALIDMILKGAKPADLPIEEPTKFELVINLKTAKALGLTIPPSVLARADQIIE